MAGLFGSARPRLGIETELPPPPPKPRYDTRPARRGLFGRIGSLVTPERLQVLGHTLQEMGGQQGALDDYLAQRHAREMDNFARQRQEMMDKHQQAEWAREDVQEEALQAWVATLTPEQRQMAAANPQAAHQAFMEAQFSQNEWTVDPRFTHAVRSRSDGSIEQGGELPLRPYAAQSGGGGSSTRYQVMGPDEVRAMGLPPGSYQRNLETGQVAPIGRTRGQYSEFAGTSAAFGNRMQAADETLRGLELTVDPAAVYAGQYNGGDQTVRQVRQAQREFVNAILRRESGAAIGETEFDSARQQYFAVPGDSPEVIEQKRQARQRAIMGLVNASQGAYQEWYGDYEPPPDPNAGAGAPQTGINRPRGNLRAPRRIRLD